MLSLVAEAAGYEPAFQRYLDLAASLTQQFWAQHYPGGDLTEVGSDYDNLRQQAGELIALIPAAVLLANEADRKPDNRQPTTNNYV